MSVTAIVLAGGRSERFGRDKLAAELDGASLLATTIAALAPLGGRVIVAGPPNPRPTTDGRSTVLADAEPFGGPLAALANVLEVTADPAGLDDLAIVVGGDMPRLVPAVLATMLDRLGAEPALEAVLLAAGDTPRRQVLPLALRVGPAASAARQLLDSGVRSLRALVDQLATLELAEREWRALDPAGDTLTDVDTRGDLERLRSRGSGHASS